ncbi:catalase [Ruegeria marina]|uniref:catalase n=1 Tax=Ruegeria marina TaxID=639004 RepID=A0A1G7BUG5_9RHOB|nr:catalase [Ruegeria marina]SDE30647.1 catalase [Ruegeria marina]
MADPKLVQDIVEALDIPGGSTQRRPVHTVGIGVTGHFVPSPIAPEYCVAEHFQPPAKPEGVPVDVRFSNGIGLVKEHDGWSDVRGMAVRFHLKDGKSTDLIAMTLSVFFAPTETTFLKFARHARPQPCKRETPWQKIKHYLKLELPLPDPYPGQTERPNEAAIAFANEHAWAQPAVVEASAIGAPVSYVRADYHAVHTFVVTGRDGQERRVRFTWAPVAGVLNTNPEETPKDKYLQKDLRDRLAGKQTERFTLMMQIGEIGDDFDDSSRQWPPHRKRVMMGTLTLEHVPDDQQAHSEKLSFNPWHLVEGIKPSGDPVLRIRKDVYEYSSNRRGGIPCPFSNVKG